MDGVACTHIVGITAIQLPRTHGCEEMRQDRIGLGPLAHVSDLRCDPVL